MNKDKVTLYVISAINFALLALALFLDFANSKIIAACILLPLSAATFFLIKRRKTLSVYKREVLALLSIVSVLYVILFQLSGLFLEFYQNPYFINSERLFDTVIPLAMVIVSSEIIRHVILSQEDRVGNAVSYLICILAEILMFSNIAGITSFNRFMDLFGLTLFPAISANAFYHYISKRHGMLPNIVFRLVTTLYIYFIPAKTGMEDALASCIEIIFPILMFGLVVSMFEKKTKKSSKHKKTLGTIATVITIVFVTLVGMLISCQFRYGALVIATGSMTGEINKGDMIIYEQYDKQVIEEGQVIVFSQNNSRVVHRVISIENVGGELRYYTKGDANNAPDVGYRVEKDIIGLVNLKLIYFGYPTLMVREIIEN